MATVIGNRTVLDNAGKRAGERITAVKVVMWAVMIVLVLITLFPFWWMLRTALTSPQAIFRDTTSLLPTDPTLNNLARVLGLTDVATTTGASAPGISGASLNVLAFFRNSVFFSLLITLGQTFFCSLSAYAFARLRFPFRDRLFFIYLTGLMVPSIVLFIPNFVLVRQLGLINTLPGMVAPV